LTYLKNSSYSKYLESTNASVIIIDENFNLYKTNKIYIKVDNAGIAFSLILQNIKDSKYKFNNDILKPLSTKPIDSEVKIGKNVSIGHFSVIEDDVIISDNTIIGSNTIISNNTTIGNNCNIFSNIHIYNNCKIGNNCVVHSGTIIGSDGFGFVTENGDHHKIPQNGNVIIGDKVEIGSNCAIDRGTIGDTILEDQCKLDNHVHLAHNVRLGKGCILTAAVTIAGSVNVGEYCVFAGHVGVAPHVTIGSHSILAAKTGVTKSLSGGKVYAGMPAREIREQHKRDALYSEVLKIRKQIEKLEK